MGDLDTSAEMSKCRVHAPGHVIGVGQTAEGIGLRLDRARFARKPQRFIVLHRAFFDSTHWKIQVSANVMNFGPFTHHAMASSDRIGLVQDVESLVVTVCDAHPSRQSEPCLTALDIVIGEFEGQFIGTD